MSKMSQKAAESVDNASHDLLAACELAERYLATAESGADLRQCVIPVSVILPKVRAAIKKAHQL